MSQIVDIDRLVDDQKIRWFNVSLLVWSFLAMFADGYDFGVLAVAQPELQTLWHVPKEAFGIASSASLVGILFGAPLLGALGDRSGRKRAIVLGSVIYGLCSLAIMFTHSIWQIALVRLMVGIGLGGIMPNAIALNSELSPVRLRATLVTLMFSGITLGSSAPGFVSNWLVPRHGWTVLFLVGAVVPLGVAACLTVALPESVKLLATQPGRQRELVRIARRMRPDLSIAEDAQFVSQLPGTRHDARLSQLFAGSLAWITPLLWVCFLTSLMSNFFLNSFLPLILRDSGMPAVQANNANALYHVGGTVGGIVMSALLDRFGFAVIAVLFVLAVPAIASLGVVGVSFGTFAPLATLAGLAVLGALFGNNAAAGLLYPTAVRSKGVGWALGIGRFGAIVGPLVGGLLLARHLPLRQLFMAAAAPMLLGAVAALLLVRLCYLRLGGLRLHDRPQRPEPAAALLPVAKGYAGPAD